MRTVLETTGQVCPFPVIEAEEAMEELDAFIDQALLNNMAQVDIIHGIGTGVIREGVTKYLRRNKHVKSFGYAPQNAGGSGATIVIFK